MVVREAGPHSAVQVAEAEKVLGHAVLYAAGADVPVLPLTRVDQNIATGIARGIAETRTTCVVIGWDGRRSPRQSIFGGVLDQLLEQTRQMIVVAKLGHALNTTERLVVVLPPLIEYQPGFASALHKAKAMASQLGATILALPVGEDPARFQTYFRSISPRVPVGFIQVQDWDALTAQLQTNLQAEDLVVVISARPGALPWHPALETLPAELADLLPESFLIVYPPADESPGSYLTDEHVLARTFATQRAIIGMPRLPYRDALLRLLDTEFAGQLAVRQRVMKALLETDRAFSNEIWPGVVVPHAGVKGLKQTMLFIGLSPHGVEFPDLRGPAYAIFLLLSPVDQPHEHLHHLAQIARLVKDPDRMNDLLGCRTTTDLVRVIRGGPQETAGAGTARLGI
jgi:mannitol/fructose-specific phosphotransferase system IIA component (Ntr-type)